MHLGEIPAGVLHEVDARVGGGIDELLIESRRKGDRFARTAWRCGRGLSVGSGSLDHKYETACQQHGCRTKKSTHFESLQKEFARFSVSQSTIKHSRSQATGPRLRTWLFVTRNSILSQ